MKKVSVALSSLFSFVLLSNFVSAADAGAFTSIGTLVNSAFAVVINFIEPVVRYLLGTEVGTDTGIFLTKVVMLIIVYSVAFIALEKTNFFTSAKWARWVIALGVGVIGVRFLDEQFIYNVILSNMALAFTVTAGLPFILFFFVVKNWPSQTARRVAWVGFAVAMFLLWAYFADPSSTSSMKFDAKGLAIAFYPIVAVLALIVAIMDGTIQGLRMKMKLEKAQKSYHRGAALGIQTKMANITTIYHSAGGGAAYMGGVATTASNGKSGTDAYIADMGSLETDLHKLLK